MAKEKISHTNHEIITKRRKLTVKEKKFAKEFAKTGNGTQSALKVYDTTDPKTASVISAENLAKPRVREEVVKLLQQNDVEMSEIIAIHRRNMVQEDHLPTSQKAVSDFYEILGMKSGEKPSTEVKIAFVIEK